MTSSPPLIDRVADDLACPGCGYSLRGLQGVVVTCPECGSPCDRASMITGRWRGPWHKAPGFSRLLWPVTWGFMLGLVTLFTAASGSHGRQTLALLVLAVGGWIALLVMVRRDLRNGLAIPLALLAHLLLFGYLAGVLAIVLAVVRIGLLGWPRGTTGLANVLVWGAVIVASVVWMWACRRGERFIAQQCIREHLLRLAAGRPRRLP
ncbi:MAG: hypothetical protein ACYTGC_01040, partial [Planctomycetota bacterium]